MSQDHAITEFLHNTDLRPSDQYLAGVPRLRPLLHFPALVAKFEAYDRAAGAAQRRLRRIGGLSLLLAMVAILGAAGQLLALALGGHAPAWAAIGLEFCGLTAIVLAAGPWFGRVRGRWLVSRFVTEQLRLWQFQSLLDGEYAALAARAPADFEQDRARRFARLESQLVGAEGAMNSLVDSESSDLHFRVTPCPDTPLADELTRAYQDLRIFKQLAYFKLKKEQLADADEWTEGLAKYSLFTALLLSLGQVLLAATGAEAGGPWGVVAASAMAGALAMAVLSAGVRVYRAATAVAQQREHYESKWVRLVALQAEFGAAATPVQRLAVMQRFELVELEELRQFLRLMRRSSYLL